MPAVNRPSRTEGSLGEFFFGTLFGFVFGLIAVVIIILMCRGSQRLKNGLFLGLIARIIVSVMYSKNN